VDDLRASWNSGMEVLALLVEAERWMGANELGAEEDILRMSCGMRAGNGILVWR
jgi:hypothetical protein